MKLFTEPNPPTRQAQGRISPRLLLRIPSRPPTLPSKSDADVDLPESDPEFIPLGAPESDPYPHPAWRP
ncbi:hypothetical protein ACFX13_027180 [Malus domestica]